MPPPAAGLSISIMGVVVQLGAGLLATMLLFGIRRSVETRGYGECWMAALLAALIGIAALSAQLVLPALVPAFHDAAWGFWSIPIRFVYQTGKLLFFGGVFLGVHAFAGSQSPSRGVRVGLVVACGAVALVTVVLFEDLNDVVVAQAVLAAPLMAVAAWRASRIPPALRGPGTAILLLGVTLLALQWTLYLPGFLFADGSDPDSLAPRILAFVIRNNSYFDAVEVIVLGIGMALALVEHDHRDAEAGQIARVGEATAARKRLGEVLRAAHEGIITVQADGTIDLLNPAAARIFGIGTGPTTGRRFEELLRPDYRDPFRASLASTSHEPGAAAHPAIALRREVFGIRPDGSDFPAEVSASSFTIDGVRGWVFVVRDLTEQLRIREEQERVRGQMAQAARLEAVGRMVSGVAHELNNPLAAIMAFSQDLAATTTSEEDREVLKVVAQQADRCRVIVGDLLIFARSKREERRIIEPVVLIERVARVFEREASRQETAFRLDVQPDLPAVDVDVIGIEQVLTNLLTNALQATPAGGTITLVLRAGADRVLLSVEDSGPGIPPEALPRIFEPFFTTKAPGDGTGLGLSVSHAIVHRHGGDLTAENRIGGGACFRIELPVAVPNGASVSAGRANGGDSGNGNGGVRPGRALVVDDEPAIRTAIRRALERRGWMVDEAGDGTEAWHRLDIAGRPADYDAVVTDLRMPGMSGMELVHRLRRDHAILADRTIVITGDTAAPSVAEFLEDLRTPHLQKPFDLATLVELVEGVRVR